MRPIAQVTTRFPKLTLGVFGLLVSAAAIFGSSVIPHLSSSGYSDPDSQSAKVADLLVSDFKQETPHLALAIGKRKTIGAAATAEVAAVADSVLQRISEDKNVDHIVSYWNSGKSPALASKNGGLGIAYIYLKSGSLDTRNQMAKSLMEITPSKIDDIHIYVGGGGAIYNGINGQITDDLKLAETLSIPLTLLALLLIFGTAMAAAQP